MQHSPEFLKLCEAVRREVKEVSVAEVKTMLEESTEGFIDVREDNEWLLGHAQGACHIGRGVIERDIEVKYPDKDKRLILYCGGGYRSALAAANLQKMGYTNVYSMIGGYSAWLEAESRR